MTLTYGGRPCCECQLRWLTLFEKIVKLAKLPRIDVAQLIGNAPASNGRHLGGGNIDWWSINVATARLARSFGCLAYLRDGTRDGFDDNKHTHGYLVGCPHMSDGAKSDLKEALAGGDGLVGNVPDDPRLAGAYVPGTTWEKGVAAMEAILEREEKIRLAEKRVKKWTRWKRKANRNIKRWKEKRP